MKSLMFSAPGRLAALAVMALSAATAFAQNGTLRFGSAAYSVKESTSAARLTVTRAGGSAGEVTVSFTTIDSDGGTAIADQDYFPTNGSLTFGPGVTSQSFVVPIINDAVHEGAETVLVQLLETSGGAVLDSSRSSTTLTITDNDACVYALNPARLEVSDRGGTAPAILVSATDGCSWTAAITSTDTPWLAIISGFAGTGHGEVVLSVDINSSPNARTAKLTIAGKSYTVTQLGVPPPDVTPPTLTISLPAANSRQTSLEVVVTGRAQDDRGVTLVEVRLENDAGETDYVAAVGAPNWQATVNGLIPGTNIIRVRAFDAVNPPTEVTRPVVFVEVRPVTIVTNGNGSITPLRNGQPLDVGTPYSARAKAASKHFFTGWSGSIVSTNNPVSFTMQPDFLLEGNFVPSPFIAVAGSYNGLFLETEARRHERSGFINVRLAELGAFSAKLVLGHQRLSCSGRFSLDGQATCEIPRAGAPPLTVTLAVDLSGESDQITGTVGDGQWAASLLADRARFQKTGNPAPQRGRYTMIVPGDDTDASNQPGGDSFATVTIDAGGNVRLSGTLADDSKMSQGALLSKNGWWPLYARLYSGAGSALSWVAFAESPEANFAGVFDWIKPARSNTRLHTNGFAVQREFSGSSYRAPTNAMDRVLTFSQGKVSFSAGNLGEAFEELVTLGDGNKVTDNGTNHLRLSIAPATGLFRGSVMPPDAARSVSFRGALHQKQNYGAGFFLGTNQSGRVRLSE